MEVGPFDYFYELVPINPFVDWVLGTIFNPTEHDRKTQAEKFYPQIWG